MARVGKRHPWDTHMKLLFTEASQAFVTWLIGDAHFVQVVSPELENETIFANILSEIGIEGQKALLHIEFQKKRDQEMAKRLWEYNVRGTIKYDCPVWSCVIYLSRDDTIEARYHIEMANGWPIHRFDFSVVKMWEIPTQEFLQTGLRDLAPLLPLTREGQRREVIETAIGLLDPPDGERKGELLTLMYGLASLVLASQADQDWLVWRFGMLYDILKDTYAWKDMARVAQQEALQEEQQKGLQKGLQEGLRLAVLEMVEARFADPALVEQTRAHVARITDFETLRRLVVKAALLQKAEELAPLLEQFPASEPAPRPARKRGTRARGSSKKQTTE